MLGTYTPDRGDVVWLNFTPQSGHERAGTRPALVVSPRAYNQKSGLMLACPITTKIKGYPFEVVIHAKKTSGVILADQIKSFDWKARKAAFVERAPKLVLSRVQQLIRLLVA